MEISRLLARDRKPTGAEPLDLIDRCPCISREREDIDLSVRPNDHHADRRNAIVAEPKPQLAPKPPASANNRVWSVRSCAVRCPDRYCDPSYKNGPTADLRGKALPFPNCQNKSRSCLPIRDRRHSRRLRAILYGIVPSPSTKAACCQGLPLVPSLRPDAEQSA